MDQELTPNLVTSYVELKEKINLKLGLTAVPSDPEFTDDKLVPKYASFAEEQGTLLQTCMMLLVKKVKPVTEESKPQVDVTTPGTDKHREQVYLEKTKPPKFTLCIEFS